MGKEQRWHTVTRTLRQFTDDEIRGAARDVSNQLDGSIMLLVRAGNQPPVEYLWGDTTALAKAGRMGGFDVEAMPDGDGPELPETIGEASHALVPWKARLSTVPNMERLRTDMSANRRSIEKLMPPDSYVAISLRDYGYFERKRIDDWTSAEHNRPDDSNELTATGALAARVAVGCADRGKSGPLAKDVAHAVFPLCDAMSSHRSRPKLGLLAVSATALALSFPAVMASPIAPVWLAGFAVLSALVALTGMVMWTVAYAPVAWPSMGVVAGVMLAGCVMLLPLPTWLVIPVAGFFTCALVRWLRRDDLWDDIMLMPRHYRWLAPQRRTTRSDNEAPDGHSDHQRSMPAYPTQRTTLLAGPQTIMSVFVPLPASSQARSQEAHPVPEPLTKGGVYLGEDQMGRACYLLPDQLYGGVAVFGAAGRGKSVLTHGVMQWAIKHRDDSAPKDWGRDSRIIDFEMKDDDGVAVMCRYRDRLWDFRNDRSQRWRAGHVSYLADPSTPCLDMLGMRDGLDARATAANVAKSMQFAFEPGDILNDSLDVITTSMTVAVAIQRHVDRAGDGGEALVGRLRMMENQYPGSGQAQAQRSPIGWCLMALAGSDGQVGTARALGQLCQSLALETKDADMVLAARAAEQLYGRPDAKSGARISDQRILDRTGASRNKVRQFMDCEHVFTSARARITWGQVLARPGDYHFVFCDRKLPDGGVLALPSGMNRKLGKWMKHRLWDTVRRDCQGWQAKGRHTMFVCDELKLLADEDDPVLGAMKDEGRAFGWVNVVATQYATQLSQRLRDSVMGYNTFISFDNPNADMAELTARQLTSSDGSDGWTAAAVQNLPKYTAAVRTRDNDQLQPAFLVRVHDFDKGLRDADMARKGEA